MSTHNKLKAEVKCPRCEAECLMEIELFFGLGNLIDYKIGDKIQWVPKKEPQNGGRPKDGNLDGDAYAVCPKCGSELNLVAEIRDDILTGIGV